MSTQQEFIWIDDTPQREVSAKNMAEALGVIVKFWGLKNKKVNEKLQEILDSEEPDLILMDHSLDQADYETVRSGSSAAAIIREKWPSCPIVSVTGTDITDMDARHRSAYDAIFQFNSISRNYHRILSIAEGFKKLKNYGITGIDDILKNLGVPDEERPRIIKILPQEFKENFTDKSLISEIFRWCENILFERPGFLYNRQWTSTLLGLNESGFSAVEEIFESSKYCGVFSSTVDERWWKSSVLSTLSEITGEVGLPWEIGRSLIKTNPEYLSKCHVSEEDCPETVAAVDTTGGAEWYPMKLKYTNPHPLFEDMLFFDELRVMKPAE